MIFRIIPSWTVPFVIVVTALITIGLTDCRGKSDQTENNSRTGISNDSVSAPDNDPVPGANSRNVSLSEADQEMMNEASLSGDLAVVTNLIQKGADPNYTGEGERTALMTVALLLERKAKPNTFDKLEHFTALMHAAAEGHLDVVKVLLEYGADPSLTDIDGDNAESFARQGNHMAVAEYLNSLTK